MRKDGCGQPLPAHRADDDIAGASQLVARISGNAAFTTTRTDADVDQKRRPCCTARGVDVLPRGRGLHVRESRLL